MEEEILTAKATFVRAIVPMVVLLIILVPVDTAVGWWLLTHPDATWSSTWPLWLEKIGAAIIVVIVVAYAISWRRWLRREIADIRRRHGGNQDL